MRRRQKLLHGTTCPFEIDGNMAKRKVEWQEVPAHGFCTMVALSTCYSDWNTDQGHGYVEQGELFKLLTEEAIRSLLPTWRTFHTGWSLSRSGKLRENIENIADKIGESLGNIEIYLDPNSNDGGLDLICFRPFPDAFSGRPVYLIQCASGRNWTDKRSTPDIQLWEKIIDFACKPMRALAIPFVVPIGTFRRHSISVEGMLLDRYRLLSAGQHNEKWMSLQLKDRLLSWMMPRVASLPEM